MTDAAGKKKLSLVPYDLKTIDKEIADKNSIIRFDKNGVDSYSVFKNPRFDEYMKKVNPEKALPVFHLGWCTDFCDAAAVLPMLDDGYQVYVLIDAMAGVFPAKTAATLKEMAEKGAHFMTTEEFIQLSKEWKAHRADYHEVLRSLNAWKKKSKTMKWALAELDHEYWKNQLPVQGQCSVLLKK